MIMNAQRTRLLRQSINEEQRRLEEARKTVVMQQCADDCDTASCYESVYASIFLMRHSRNRLHSLAQSMAAIENRLHARCLGCGEEISSRRLAAVPGAVRCAACQEEWEEEALHSPSREDAYTFLPFPVQG